MKRYLVIGACLIAVAASVLYGIYQKTPVQKPAGQELTVQNEPRVEAAADVQQTQKTVPAPTTLPAALRQQTAHRPLPQEAGSAGLQSSPKAAETPVKTPDTRVSQPSPSLKAPIRTAKAQTETTPVSAPETSMTCEDLKTALRSGTDPRTALKDALRRSREHCGLIRCALESGVPLKTVFLAAQDAGVRSSFVAQCSNSACAQAYGLLETDDLCRIIKSEIEKGRPPESVLLEQLRRGQQACTAIKCALVAGGEVESVVRAAREARVAPDIISRCCLDACADPARVARALEETGVAGLTPDEFIPIDSNRPGGARRTWLSPSGF